MAKKLRELLPASVGVKTDVTHSTDGQQRNRITNIEEVVGAELCKIIRDMIRIYPNVHIKFEAETVSFGHNSKGELICNGVSLSVKAEPAAKEQYRHTQKPDAED